MFVADSVIVPTPDFVNAPAPEITPDNVTAFVLFTVPPLLPIAIALSIVVAAPVIFKTAPAPLRVRVPVPKLASLAIDKLLELVVVLPPLIVVLVWVLVPDKITAPVPALPAIVRLPLLMTPLNVRLLVIELSIVRSAPPKSTPPVKVRAFEPDIVKVPPNTKSLLMVRLAMPARTLPPSMVNVPLPMALSLLNCNMPLFNVVPPV